MAHFAKIENNTVTSVIVISNEVCDGGDFPESEPAGQAFIADILKLDGEWKQCSYSSSFRSKYPGIGFTFNPEDDVFVAPQPFSSWTLDENNDWQSPTPKPSTGGPYRWSEEDLEWVAI